MGHVNGSSGIYLGAGWVLTAAHVGPGNVDFNGTVFQYDGNSQRLTNSDGSATDIVIFHLASLPGLARMPIAASTPPGLAQVDLMGFGFIGGSAEISISNYTGFYWSAVQLKSWGNNKVDQSGLTTINEGLGDLTCFTMDFTSPSTGGPTAQTSDEAMAAPGDSGGGVFQHVGSSWHLVGMIDSIAVVNNPWWGTAVYGDSTYAADIATYAPQINAIVTGIQPVLSIARSGSNLMVCWPDSGLTYLLEATASLTSTNWATLSPALSNTNGQICALLPAGDTSRFFRLQKQ